ncbi:MAG: hypothetical protein JST54_13895 [Deltaproteobacteria bacterium]|nr:hypothetical protein [Deltaproteobacteria bacterium]
MTKRLALCACVLAASGCAVEASPARGDLSVTWRFAGTNCTTASVTSVNVRLFDSSGGSVANDSFACSQAPASYTQLAIGTYTYDVSGFSADGARTYEASGTAVIHAGANSFDLNLNLPP